MPKLSERSLPSTFLSGFLSMWAFCLCWPPHGHIGAAAASAVFTHVKGKTNGFFLRTSSIPGRDIFPWSLSAGFSLHFTMLIFQKLMVSIYVLKSLDTMILNLLLEPFLRVWTTNLVDISEKDFYKYKL